MLKSISALLCALACSLSANELLFVGFDAGETNIWAQVLKDWDDAPDHQIATMAAATRVAKSAGLDVIEIACSGQRLEELSAAELDKIAHLSTKALVTGMYSAPEKQIAEAFAKRGVKVYAVWDNFSTFDKLPPELTANVEKILRVADAILVPSYEIAADLNARFHTDKAIALGQPTLDLWETEIARVDKKAALAKTTLRHGVPILTYIGGYEEKGNGYLASFEQFVHSVRAIKRPVQVLVQLHPRSDGTEERKMVANEAAQWFISDGKALTIFEAIALGDLGVCHRSTVAIQSLFIGKRCIHVDVPGTPFSHFAIEQQMVPQCLTVEAAASYISEHLDEKLVVDNLYEQSGIADHATKRYRDFLNTSISDCLVIEKIVLSQKSSNR